QGVSVLPEPVRDLEEVPARAGVRSRRLQVAREPAEVHVVPGDSGELELRNERHFRALRRIGWYPEALITFVDPERLLQLGLVVGTGQGQVQVVGRQPRQVELGAYRARLANVADDRDVRDGEV